MPHALDCTPGVDTALPAPIIELLKALDIEAIIFDLNGGGDSGETTLEELRYRDGRAPGEIPQLPIAITSYGAVATLGYYLSDTAADAPEGDWVNNEGGYGTATILPFAAVADDCLTCEMTYREEYDDDEPHEDWDQSLDEFDVTGTQGEGDATAAVVVLGELQS